MPRPQPQAQPSPTNLQNAYNAGSITQSIQRTRQVAGFTLLINVECQSEAEADEAIAAGANIVMLDNLVGDELHGTAKRLKDKWRGKREFLIETSGGIVEDGLVARLRPDVDVLSTSAVHQVSDIRGSCLCVLGAGAAGVMISLCRRGAAVGALSRDRERNANDLELPAC